MAEKYRVLRHIDEFSPARIRPNGRNSDGLVKGQQLEGDIIDMNLEKNQKRYDDDLIEKMLNDNRIEKVSVMEKVVKPSRSK